MAIAGRDLELEKRRLVEVLKLVDDKIVKMSNDIFDSEDKFMEFRKYTWDNLHIMDDQEVASATIEASSKEVKLDMDKEYFKKLCRLKDNPYFASVVFEDDDGERFSIYLGITYLKDEDYGNIIYDWRSPICSLFYDYETGPALYMAPMGPISGELLRKRQYKIEKSKLVSAFDNSMSIDDELLQEVLAKNDNDKMKNIVNTIQQEQNSVIRNVRDRTLIVSGIAGSGKTSVALHRIAFLLYKIKDLTSNDILIFSPNQIFTEYISDVLPELGENNTLQTTFNDYLCNSITEFNSVQSFMDFIGSYYSEGMDDFSLLQYKQSDDIISDLENFVLDYVKRAKVVNDFKEQDKVISCKEINEMIKERYSNLPFFERIEEIALKLSEKNYKGSSKKRLTFRKLIFKNGNFTNDLKEIFVEFFGSDFAKFHMNDKEIRKFLNGDEISYPDALLFVYLKGLLQGFYYEKDIRQVVIDEAQDYNYLQYLIISKIFRNSSFTILGDVNQTINPYYKYDTLDRLAEIFPKSKCISLNKTYRSSPEIVEFTNKILGLDHVCAIRKTDKTPLIHRTGDEKLSSDIRYLKNKYKSVAIITRDSKTAEVLYEKLKGENAISLLSHHSEKYSNDLVILPAYLSKGLEFDSVVVYSGKNSKYGRNERNLLYVACTRAQHELIVYS